MAGLHAPQWYMGFEKEGLQMTMSRANMGKQISRPGKVKKVMHEFKVGTLKSSSGMQVKKRKQAVAIAISEATRPHRPRRAKRSFK